MAAIGAPGQEMRRGAPIRSAAEKKDDDCETYLPFRENDRLTRYLVDQWIPQCRRMNRERRAAVEEAIRRLREKDSSSPHVDLVDKDLTDYDLMLMSVLLRHSAVSRVDVSRNMRITSAGLQALGDAVADMPKLQTLIAVGMGVDARPELLWECIDRSSGLTTLIVGPHEGGCGGQCAVLVRNGGDQQFRCAHCKRRGLYVEPAPATAQWAGGAGVRE